MDITRTLARQPDGAAAGPKGSTAAVEAYVEAFPNIARDRFVWPVIDRAIRRRFATEAPRMDVWRSAVGATLDGRAAGSIAKILWIYEERLIEAKRFENAGAKRLPENGDADPTDVHAILDLLARKLKREITQEQFDREAALLSRGG